MLSAALSQQISSVESKSVALWSQHAGLTSSVHCRFFCCYRDIAGAIYPVLEDVRGFENTLEFLLQNRTTSGGVYREDANEAQTPFGVSIAYLGLLFAILASGCQSSDLASKERELTSQVYGMFILPGIFRSP